MRKHEIGQEKMSLIRQNDGQMKRVAQDIGVKRMTHSGSII